MGLELVPGGSFGRCNVNYMKKMLSSAAFISMAVDSLEVTGKRLKMLGHMHSNEPGDPPSDGSENSLSSFNSLLRKCLNVETEV